jgi:hypothetical protein
MYSEEIDDLKERMRRVSGLFQNAALDYERKVSGPHCGDIFLLRNSVVHRVSAIRFHINMMHDFERHASDVIGSPKGLDAAHQLEAVHTHRMRCMFDDVVFNLMSLFDYIAGFLAYVFYGDKIRDRADGYNPLRMKEDRSEHLTKVLVRIDWRRISDSWDRKTLAGLGGDEISGAKIEPVLEKWDQKLLSHLRTYRNDVIHNREDYTRGGWRISIGNSNDSDIFIHPPSRFTDQFDLPESANENLFDSALWLVQQAMNASEELIEKVHEDIEDLRQVPRGQEHIRWKHEIEEDNDN